MEYFYDKWLGGQEIRTAFHNTQKQLRAKYPGEPYKWAAFVMVE
jgi:CHAT domain-containing protein